VATWKGLATTAVVLGLMQSAIWGQQKSARPMTLSTMDYIEIRQLASRYAFAVDTGSNNGYDYADLFSADGEFMRPYAKGRDQLASLARGGRLGPFNIVHYITNHVIEPTPDGAVGKQYLIELNWDLNRDQAGRQGQAGPAPNAQSQDASNQNAQSARERGGLGPNRWDLIGRKGGELARVGGHYEDVYVKTAEGWRFKKRDFVPSKSGPDPAPPPPPRVRDTSQQAAVTPSPPTGFVEPTRQSTLTAMDYLQIQQLVSSYGHALDSGYGKGENGTAYADLYTRDATFGNNTGRDRLIEVAKIEPRGPDYVRHYLFNHVIEPTPQGVKGKEYLIVIDVGENGTPSTLYLGGHYEETYVKTADGWRMKNRRLFPPRSGPQPANAQTAAAPSAPLPAPHDESPAAKGARPRSTLTDADYMGIQQLAAKAAYALDAATDRGQAFARLFTPDGVFRAKLSQPFEVKGREQLAAYAMGDLTHRGPAYVRDYTTNHIIFPSPEGATGRLYLIWIEVGENGNPGVVQSGGRYEDVYVNTADGWRIKSRTFVPAKLGARETWEYSPAH
jgi:SnoaL-like domain